MRPFVQTSPPSRLKEHPINAFADWYKWSDEFKETLLELRDLAAASPPPQLINLHNGKPYDYSYTVAARVSDSEVHEKILQSVKCLYELKPSRRLMLLTELIDQQISSETMHYLFAYFQYCFGLISGTPDTAMYAPLGDLSDTGFPFPLHADLYVQRFLMVVFDIIPTDGSGQSLLIPTSQFLQIVNQLSTMPDEAKSHVEKLLTDHPEADRFDDFFHFVYKKEAPWTTELSLAVEAHQLKIKFERGEGFLLDDREWLHGRTAPSCAVRVNRLHRLIFNVRSGYHLS